MQVDYVHIANDRSLNGQVVHARCSNKHKIHRTHHLCTSGWGRGHKKHTNDNMFTYGQDAFSIAEDAITVADGHGVDGDQVAMFACEAAMNLPKPLPKDIMCQPRRVERDLRDSVEQIVRGAPQERGGATLVHMMFVQEGQRRWVITVNVGDSEALLLYRNRVHVCSVAHSWDNLEVYRRYEHICPEPRDVCYNRWNAGKHKLKDSSGEYKPIHLYTRSKNGISTLHQSNAMFMKHLHERKRRPDLRYGTQSTRIPSSIHENWGSSVLVHGRARGQVMASVGDHAERALTGVPYDLIHVYIHEVPPDERVVAVVQTDGIVHERTLRDCGSIGWSCGNAKRYLEDIRHPRDDMAAAMAIWEPNPRKTTPYQVPTNI